MTEERLRLLHGHPLPFRRRVQKPACIKVPVRMNAGIFRFAVAIDHTGLDLSRVALYSD